MDRRFLLVIVSAVCVVSTVMLYFFFTMWYVVDVRDVQTNFRVVDPYHIGIDVNRSVLNFGAIPQGGAAQRSITLESKVKAKAVISTDEGVHGWLVPSVNPVLLDPGVPVTLNVSLRPPPDAPQGNYTGTTRITYFRRFS